jgi:hypothetical protein
MAMTPTEPQRSVKGAPDTTRPASLTASKARTPTHAVQGPAKIGEGDGRTMTTPSGPPPLHGTAPQSVKPKEQP